MTEVIVVKAGRLPGGRRLFPQIDRSACSDLSLRSTRKGSRGKLKVAAYCRVSTLLPSQETSIESQREHYEQEILANKDWEMAGIYLEAGITGTKAEVRPELKRLLSDCKDGKVDMILTKSISRFSRNTVDCLEMVRTLTSLGVTIRFAKEAIDTGTMDSELMLTILACLAENESRSISDNMKWGIRKRFKAGTFRQSVLPYGYERKDGEFAPVPEKAEIVKRIFDMTLSGYGMNTIAHTLNKEKIPGPLGKEWSPETLKKIVINPAYKGDTLYQKTFVDENFSRKKNKGELDRYYDAGHHDAIICTEEFESAQSAIAQRAMEVGYRKDTETSRNANRYCFSGILICSSCGSVMHRQAKKNGNAVWICCRHSKDAELCQMKPQSDADLKAAFINCLNKLSWAQNIKSSQKRLLEVYEAMLVKAGSEKQQAKKHIHDIEAPISSLRRLKALIKEWSITDDPAAFPAEIFAELVKFCTVDSRKKVTFHFRCGPALTESLCVTEAG